MARRRIPFTGGKLSLYFDENCPAPATVHFRSSSFWRKKVKIIAAAEVGNKGRDDQFHFNYCKRNRYTLVSLDDDFADDRKYPFSNGDMCGIIIVKASKGDVQRFVSALAMLLTFVRNFLFPKDLLIETKFVCSEEGAVMRGRVVGTKEISSLYITRGTTVQAVREHFRSF